MRIGIIGNVLCAQTALVIAALQDAGIEAEIVYLPIEPPPCSVFKIELPEMMPVTPIWDEPPKVGRYNRRQRRRGINGWN